MSRISTLVVIAIVTALSAPGWAQGDANAQLQDRVKDLEQQVQELTDSLSPEDGQTQSGEKKPLWSSLDVQFYGYIKADAAWTSSRATPGNYVLYLNEGGEDDDELNLTANETRLGFNITGPKTQSMVTSGNFEFDLYGSSAPENKAKIQMRHAYIKMLWPDSDMDLIAGQTWDIISPLNPATVNYSVLWNGGNIGYRRPQIRLTKRVMTSPDNTLTFAGGITRTLGDDAIVTEAGEDAGFPTLQGRIGWTFPWLDAGATTLGFSGHWGEEEYDGHIAGDVDTWSINVDYLQPLCSKVALKAEVFKGENLDTYLGGIGQGVNSTTGEAIESKGGWVALAMGPWDAWTFHAGVGIDDVDSGDVEVGDRTDNRCLFGNAVYAVNKHLDVACELSHWSTDYRGEDDSDGARIQFAAKYKF